MKKVKIKPTIEVGGLEINMMVDKQGARTVAILAMADQLFIDLLTKFPRGSMAHQEVKDIREKIEQINKRVPGFVPDKYIHASERFFYQSQKAIDGFWDKITEEQLYEIKTMKEKHSAE